MRHIVEPLDNPAEGAFNSTVMSSPIPLDLNARRLYELRFAALDETYVSLGGRRTASVHEFYRYPARFSPFIARAAINAFSEAGQLVVDPFGGGGTSAVEAQLCGRHSASADLNPLASFVTMAKTTLYCERDIESLASFVRAVPTLSLTVGNALVSKWAEDGYWRNISGPDTWRIRNLLISGINAVDQLSEPGARLLGRCALLRTGQWALDMRQEIPSVKDFRSQLIQNIEAMAVTVSEHREQVIRRWGEPHEPLVVSAGLPESAEVILRALPTSPALILTSPPYPGAYVNYHRWKVRGRRETPAPYWIVDRRDGHGISHYTMSARNRDSSRSYFVKLRRAYRGVVRLMDRATWLVQVVGFRESSSDFQSYLGLMNEIGLHEIRLAELATEMDGRLWRDIPGRRWWIVAGSRALTTPSIAREVILIHRKK